MSTKKKFLFLTNIPTPYRTSFYNHLFKLGFNFEVLYMRQTESDRSWRIDPKDMQHTFYVDRGMYLMLGHRYHLHVNPRLMVKMIGSKDSEFIIGGAWNDVNVLILVLLKRLGLIRNVFHFWSEANHLTNGARNDNFLKRGLRKFVYNTSVSSQISSGEMTRITFEKWGMPGKKFIALPNTIEEEEFIITDREISARALNDMPIFFVPARLIESIKGIINFFRSIGNENIRKSIFLIAGEGPDQDAIESYVVDNDLKNHVKLLGQCDTSGIVKLYKKANVFFLPSYSDPSPLCVVEALRMQLPLLMSNRCGNHFEALDDGRNGYLFDPSAPAEIKRAYEALMARKDDWLSMGKISGARYEEYFSKDRVIPKFIEDIQNFSPDHA